MSDDVKSDLARLQREHDLEALRFIEKVLPGPAILLFALVTYLSSQPGLTLILVGAIAALNITVNQLAIRKGRPATALENNIRGILSVVLLLGIGWVSGPSCPSVLAAVPSVCGTPFVQRSAKTWLWIVAPVVAVCIGSIGAGAELWQSVTLAVAELGVGVVLVAAVNELRTRQLMLQRTLDQATRASRVKSEFLAVMNHEIRTPLHGIAGVLSLLEPSKLDDETKDHLDVLSRCAQDIHEVMTDILEFSELQGTEARLDDDDDFEPTTLVEQVFDGRRTSADAAGVELRTEIEPRAAVGHRGPARSIGQVLDRLLHNAIAFCPGGVVTVGVAATDDGLRFEVRDTGPGIPEGELDSIFEAFTQVDSSTTRTHGGIGVGLAICKRIVTLMDGRIGVENQPETGSCFWFLVPCRASSGARSEASDPERASEPPEESPPLAPAEIRVLAVDDNVINRRVIMAMLGKLGYQAEIAADGREAVERSAEVFYPVILMDCFMPVMDGYEATRAIRQRSGPAPRIIGVTADTRSDARHKCLQAGMDDYLAKPVSLAQLRERIEIALGQ